MTDSEKLDLMLSQLVTVKSEIQGMKSEMQGMKSEMQEMKSEMQEMKSEIQEMELKINSLDIKTIDELAKVNLILENDIKPNIRLIVENYEPAATSFETAVDKVNQHEDDIKLLNLGECIIKCVSDKKLTHFVFLQSVLE